MSIIEKLSEVQKQLKAPKNQYNSFGKYNYRNCEDILEAVKKIMPNDCSLTLSDDVLCVGEGENVRFYVQAKASFMCGGDIIENTAVAREAENKKGMDDSQISGTASSYARKYALNGLFLIDDTKDADTDENTALRTGKKATAKPAKKAAPKAEAPEEEKPKRRGFRDRNKGKNDDL